ncbi:hypothetical protein [Nocardioides sp.]|jgi:hypothetical protein|uniref:hypothetical protein n=1 Tax=Nocardioides sp. TaxID=35761 RepID=UPI0031FE889D|nr:hypothetical protein [Nocardioides sp.]
MSTQASTRDRPDELSTHAWVCLGLSALAGPVGLTLVGFVLLLRMRIPHTVAGQSWRILGLSACGTAVGAGAVGGVVGLVLGRDYPPTLVFAFLEGGVIAGVPGFVLGTLVGAVAAVAHLRRFGRP